MEPIRFIPHATATLPRPLTERKRNVDSIVVVLSGTRYNTVATRTNVLTNVAAGVTLARAASTPSALGAFIAACTTEFGGARELETESFWICTAAEL